MRSLFKPIPLALAVIICITFAATAFLLTHHHSAIAAAQRNAETQKSGCACCGTIQHCGPTHIEIPQQSGCGCGGTQR
ncbi:MAG: hypothetical protein OXH39_00355 [Candidatus Poribacteria bacterium]|nr:hypothetical protein [Candidatus Poribacteria bacterium]